MGIRHSLIFSWLHQQALRGAGIDHLLLGLCERLLAAGLNIERAVVGNLIFHPQFDAVDYRWTPGPSAVEALPVSRHDMVPQFQNSPTPFSYLHSTAVNEVRQRLSAHDYVPQFRMMRDLQERGFTDYIALFEPYGTVADPALWDDLPAGVTMREGVATAFATKQMGGFKEAEVDLLRSLMPPLAVAVKVRGALEMSERMLGTYLGHASGQSVFRGHVRRGQGRVIHAVIWHSDLRDSTHLAQSLPLPDYLGTLNSYYDGIVEALEQHGGEVLKFIGDGVLAMFPFDPGTKAGASAAEGALAAVEDAIARLHSLNLQREEVGLPLLRCGIALHSGDVMYGNVGSAHRLDFTVTGPAVNEVTRLETLCKSLGVPVAISDAVARLTTRTLRPLGSHELRGVSRRIQAFTLAGP